MSPRFGAIRSRQRASRFVAERDVAQTTLYITDISLNFLSCKIKLKVIKKVPWNMWQGGIPTLYLIIRFDINEMFFRWNLNSECLFFAIFLFSSIFAWSFFQQFEANLSYFFPFLKPIFFTFSCLFAFLYIPFLYAYLVHFHAFWAFPDSNFVLLMTG